MILTLLSFFVLFVGGLCFLIHFLTKDYDENWFGAGFIVTAVGTAFLIVCIGVISMKEIHASVQIAKFEAVRQTIKIARESEEISDYEIVAMQHKAVDKNEWLANARFFTEHPLTNWFWSKRILEIKPIK